MLFKVSANSKIEPVGDSKSPLEADLENYILPDLHSDEPNILNREIFREPLLLLGNQVRTRRGRKAKRTDILAIDNLGNVIIIELKKDSALVGAGMQALQYLAEFSPHKGEKFISYFLNNYKYSGSLEDDIKGLGIRIADVNRYNRIILIARNFDVSLFSMGKWLAENKVAFRCIEYSPFTIGSDNYLSFSVVFDQSPSELFPLSFLPQTRDPQYFWHNIGNPENTLSMQAWWEYLVQSQEIRTSFSNKQDDEGERILRGYKDGDTIIAYASGHGAVGWGKIESPNSYKLLKPNGEGDVLSGRMLHCMKIRWQTVVKDVSSAISVGQIIELGGYFPRATRVKIEDSVATHLINKLNDIGIKNNK